jgi:hypothetical protein
MKLKAHDWTKKSDKAAAVAAASKDGKGDDAVSPGRKADKAPMTAGEWYARIKPRIEGIHGSQPIFDDRKAVSSPATYCVMSGDDEPQHCQCYTEQVTPISGVLYAVCKQTALHGQYDPFRGPALVGAAPTYQAMPSPDADTGDLLGGSGRGSPLEVGSRGMGLVQGK